MENEINETPAQEEAKRPVHRDIAELVKSKVADAQAGDLSSPVVNTLVDTLAQKEVASLVDTLAKGYELSNALSRALNKIKPDNVAYDQNGKEVRSEFSKAKVEEIKKLREDFKKVDDGLNEAINKRNFEKLKQAIQKVKAPNTKDSD